MEKGVELSMKAMGEGYRASRLAVMTLQKWREEHQAKQ